MIPHVIEDSEETDCAIPVSEVSNLRKYISKMRAMWSGHSQESPFFLDTVMDNETNMTVTYLCMHILINQRIKKPAPKTASKD